QDLSVYVTFQDHILSINTEVFLMLQALAEYIW
ncbi:MAG: hypothetical protein ACI9MF_001105, partial [Gammaproteobacteria bacterium]